MHQSVVGALDDIPIIGPINSSCNQTTTTKDKRTLRCELWNHVLESLTEIPQLIYFYHFCKRNYVKPSHKLIESLKPAFELLEKNPDPVEYFLRVVFISGSIKILETKASQETNGLQDFFYYMNRNGKMKEQSPKSILKLSEKILRFELEYCATLNHISRSYFKGLNPYSIENISSIWNQLSTNKLLEIQFKDIQIPEEIYGIPITNHLKHILQVSQKKTCSFNMSNPFIVLRKESPLEDIDLSLSKMNTIKEISEPKPDETVSDLLIEENTRLLQIVSLLRNFIENNNNTQIASHQTIEIRNEEIGFNSIPPYAQIGLLVFAIWSKNKEFKKSKIVRIPKQKFCRVFDALMERFGIWNNTRTLLENNLKKTQDRQPLRYLKDDHLLYQEIIQTLATYRFIKVLFESKRNHKIIDFAEHCKNRKLTAEACASDPEQYIEYLQLTRSIQSIIESINVSETPMKQAFLDACDDGKQVITDSLKVSPQKISKEILLNELRNKIDKNGLCCVSK